VIEPGGACAANGFAKKHRQSEPIDREVLALRHFEATGCAAAALILGNTEEAGASDTSGPWSV
jgi:hypothetical protein